jgi:large repetitive protein
MAAARIQIGTLPGAELGRTIGNQFTIDPTADGYGWFIALSPADDTEFRVSTADGQRHAIDPRAVNHIDLLTVVEHELGHVAGLADVHAADNGLMDLLLAAGVRRSPSASAVDALFAGFSTDR